MRKEPEEEKRRIIMPEDNTPESANRFPEPVSRSYAFDDAFFEESAEKKDDGQNLSAVPDFAEEEETELAYDFGLFGAANHSAAVYRPKPKKTPPPITEPASPAEEGEVPDFFSDLFDSINEELAQMETAETGIPPKEQADEPAKPTESNEPAEPTESSEPPEQPEPLEQSEPPRGKNTVTYDEFRARFASEDLPEEPAREQTDFKLHSDVELDEGEDWTEEGLLPSTREEATPLVSAAAMNIVLDTEAEDETGELIEQSSASDDEDAAYDNLALKETAKGQLAEYYPEGEDLPELVAPYSPPKGNFFTRNIIPVKGDSAAEVIRKIIMSIALLAVIGSAGYLFNDYVITPYRTANQIDQLSEMIDEDNTNVVDEAVQSQFSDVDFPEGMMEKYAQLYARNADFVGWLSIDALDISLPVVQGESNTQYLKTDFDGKKNKYGSLFVNCYNDMKQMDMNTTIFGHNMKDSKMLGNLVYYRTVKGYQKAPVIEFNTLYHDYKWKVFAVILTNGEKAGDRGYLFNYMFANLSSEEKMEEYLGEIKQRSLYYPEVDIALSDKILTISTCVYDFDDARLVILARMVRPGESTAVSGRVYGNDNPRYPQMYYDKMKWNNPYADAEKWYPS